MTKQELVERFKKQFDEIRAGAQGRTGKPPINPVIEVVLDTLYQWVKYPGFIDKEYMDVLISEVADEMLIRFKDADIKFFFKQLKLIKKSDTTQEDFMDRYKDIQHILYQFFIEPYLEPKTTPDWEAPRPEGSH